MARTVQAGFGTLIAAGVIAAIIFSFAKDMNKTSSGNPHDTGIDIYRNVYITNTTGFI